MISRPPGSNLTYTLCPYTTLFRSPVPCSAACRRNRSSIPSSPAPIRSRLLLDLQLDNQIFLRRTIAHAANRGGIAIVEPGKSRSEEHTSELQSLMRLSYAVFCLKKTNDKHKSD